jgi:hypothetical protein
MELNEEEKATLIKKCTELEAEVGNLLACIQVFLVGMSGDNKDIPAPSKGEALIILKSWENSMDIGHNINQIMFATLNNYLVIEHSEK